MIDDTGTLTRHAREQQLRRFEALHGLGRFDGRSVLEIGCGTGDFYRYLTARGERPLYTGLETSGELAAEGRARFSGDESCRFEAGDAAHYQPSTPFDFVVASGELSEGAFSGAGALVEALTRVFSWCTVGAAACFCSARVPGRAPGATRVDPASAVKAALRLTPAVRLAHDYMPADFTIFLYRTPPWGAVMPSGAVQGASDVRQE